MPHPIEPSTLRILHPNGPTVGTGFLVAPNLIVTCAHVVELADAIPGDTIRVQFTGQTEKLQALVLPEFWSDAGKDDVAILQLDKVPAGIFPLPMERAGTCKFRAPLYTFGYAQVADEEGIAGSGEFRTWPKDSKVFQFRMHEADHGHSGAPMLDVNHGVVIGMIQKGNAGADHNTETAFAIPTEIIWQVCPQLKPPTPILPRRNPIVEGINLLPYDYDQRIQNFLTEYLGTDSHSIPFGGRDEALRMLDTWLAETTPYLLLAAPAGRGKSALLVRWLDSLKAREDLAMAFVPVSIRFGTNMERVFYAALAARLAFLHGDDIPASPEISTAVYHGLVSDYLSKPLANGQTLLVVLDGLDEAADWQVGADFMPGELPAGVRVVVSARFLAGDADSIPWLCRLNWERNGSASAPSLTPLDRVGVADVLLKMGCPLDELSHNLDIVAELYRLSEGDPLLVGLYVGDLWAKGEAVTRLKPEDLAGIQPGYQGYFDRWWDDQKKLWGKDKPWLEKYVRAVRNLLAGALGPLFRDDFQSLDSELESVYIADALDILQRFIIGDNRAQGYTFSHPKLGQYFWESLTQTEQLHVEGRFLSWGEQTLEELIDGKRDPRKKSEIPTYVVRNYGTHLVRARQPIEKYIPLIHHQQWAQAWLAVEGAYGGYLQDVQRVWKQGKVLDQQAFDTIGKAPYLGEQVRCALIESSLHSLAGNIPSELIPLLVSNGIWTLAQTWVFIRQMPEPRMQFSAFSALLPFLTDKHLMELLEVARAIGDDEVYADTLSAMSQYIPDEYLGTLLEAAREIRDHVARAHILGVLIKRLPEVRKEALDAIRAIPDEVVRARMANWLVVFFPDGELEQFLEIAQTIRSEESRASVLCELAKYFPPAKLKRLMEIASSIIDERLRAGLLDALANYLPESELGRVVEMAQGIRDELSRARVLVVMAERLPEEELGKLFLAVRTILDEKERASLLCKLSKRIPNLVMEALKAAQAIPDEWSRNYMLCELAQSLPEVADEALESIQGMDEHFLPTLVSCLLERGISDNDLGQVMEAVRTINSQDSKARILYELAQHLPTDKLGQIVVVARAIGNENSLAYVWSTLAERLPDGELDQLLDIARAISNGRGCASLLSVLLQRRPDMADEALAIVQAIDYDMDHARALSELVPRLPGLQGEALEAWLAICIGRERARVLSAFAQHLPEIELRQMLEAVENFGNDRDMGNGGIGARAMSEMARHLPELTEEALEVAQVIGDESEITHLLTVFVPYLSEQELRSVLELARTQENEWDRSKLLIELAKYVPEAGLNQMLVMARAIKNEDMQIQILCELALRLPKMRKEVLEKTQAIEREVTRVELLSRLAQGLPEEELSQILEMSRPIQSDWARAKILSTLAVYLPMASKEILKMAQGIRDEKELTVVLCKLAQCMPEDELGQILDAALVINSEWERVQVLIELMQRFPKGNIAQVLEAIRAITHVEYRAHALSLSVQRFPEISEEALNTVRLIESAENRFERLRELVHYVPDVRVEALDAARGIGGWWRAGALSEMMDYFPDLKDEALEVACAIESEEYRAKMLRKLVLRLPMDELDRIWDVTWNIDEKTERMKVVSALASRMIKLSPKKCYWQIEKYLSKQACRTRPNLLFDITALIPVLLHIGGEDTDNEILQAVDDVSQWWK